MLPLVPPVLLLLRRQRLGRRPLVAPQRLLGRPQIARRAPQHPAGRVVPLQQQRVPGQAVARELGLVRVEPAAQLGPHGQRGRHRRQRFAGAVEFLLGALLQAFQQRRQPVPLSPAAVLRGRHQLLVQRRRGAADRRHLGRGDLGQHLAARLPRLGQRAIGPGEHIAQLHQASLGVLADIQHRLDLPPYVLQGARRTVVAHGVRPAATGGRTPRRGRHPERQRIGDHLRAQPGQFVRDPLQVVARRMLTGAYAHGVRQRTRPLKLGRQQIYPGRQRGPHRVGGDDHIERAGVEAVDPLDELRQAEALRPCVRSGRSGRSGRCCRSCRSCRFGRFGR